MGFIGNIVWSIKHSYRVSKYEKQYAGLMPIIAEETRNYIQMMRESEAIAELAQELLAGGTPETIKVYESLISWQYGNEASPRTIEFRHIGLPNLSIKHKFSDIIHNAMWHAFDGDEIWYANRFSDALKYGGIFQREYPDVFGIWNYDFASPYSDTIDDRPCINECAVVGILLCRRIGVKYIYNCTYTGAEFARHYPQTRSW